MLCHHDIFLAGLSNFLSLNLSLHLLIKYYFINMYLKELRPRRENTSAHWVYHLCCTTDFGNDTYAWTKFTQFKFNRKQSCSSAAVTFSRKSYSNHLPENSKWKTYMHRHLWGTSASQRHFSCVEVPLKHEHFLQKIDYTDNPPFPELILSG